MANIELDGANKKIKVDSGDLTLDIPGDIILDADGGDLTFADGGTNLLKVTNSSSDVVFQPQVDAKDIIFKQYDGRALLDINDGGFVGIYNGATGPGQLRLYEDTDNGTNYSAFQVGTQSGDITYTLPTADGSNGHFLSTNGSGTLSWAAAAFSVSDITGATALTAEPASTDEMILSDAGTLKRMDFAHIMARPAFLANDAGDQTLSNNTMTLGEFATETFDTDGKYTNTSSNYKFTPGLAGYYWCFANAFFSGITDGTTCTVTIKKNGLNAEPWSWGNSAVVGADAEGAVRTSGLIYLDSDDYIQVGLKQNEGSDVDTVTGRSYFGAFRVVGVG